MVGVVSTISLFAIIAAPLNGPASLSPTSTKVSQGEASPSQFTLTQPSANGGIDLIPCSQLDARHPERPYLFGPQDRIYLVEFDTEYSLLVPAYSLNGVTLFSSSFHLTGSRMDVFDLSHMISSPLQLSENQTTAVPVNFSHADLLDDIYVLKLNLTYQGSVQSFCAVASIGHPVAIFIGNAGDGEVSRPSTPSTGASASGGFSLCGSIRVEDVTFAEWLLFAAFAAVLFFYRSRFFKFKRGKI